MSTLEDKIKAFVREQGVAVVGLAGSERLDGPPSLDLAYSMRGGRSIISMALPMHVGAIDDFLAKRSPAPHNLDQFLSYQRLQRIGQHLADYLVTLGYRARALPLSADYRRSPYVFSTRPAFSHRLGAIAAGIAAQGWSGNVMTREYGAAIYLGSVVTDAELRSDPMLEPRYFLDTFCTKCKRCAAACPSRMFESDGEESILLNGELYQRGKRRSIYLCDIACFGIHSLSLNRKWTNWGRQWIEAWVAQEPDPTHEGRMILSMLSTGLAAGDATPRFDVLKRLCSRLWPENILEGIPAVDELPEDETQRYRILARFVARLGIKGMEDYPIPMVCGHCALVCGPDPEESARRYKTLVRSGFVVPGEGRRMVRVDTFEEAQALRRRYARKVSLADKCRDTVNTFLLWHLSYFGLEPRTMLHHRTYRRRLAEAVRSQTRDPHANARIQG